MRAFWILLWTLVTAAAWAQDFDRPYADAASLKLASPLEWVAVPKGMVASPDAFLAEPQKWSFQPYKTGSGVPTSDTHEVWVRFSTPPTASPQEWFVRIPRISLSKASLYMRDAAGRWNASAAGLDIAPALWPVRSRLPSFSIYTSTEQLRVYYLRLENGQAVTERPQLVSAVDYIEGAARVGILLGLIIGIFGLLVILSVVAYWLMTSMVFVWFGLFVVGLMSSQLVLMGYGGWRVWPSSQYLNAVMMWVVPYLTLASAAWFCAQASYARDVNRWVYRMLCVATAGNIAMALLALATTALTTSTLRNSWVVLSVAIILCSLVWMTLRGNRWNVWLLVGLLPIGLAALARLAYNFGWVAQVEFAQAVGLFSAVLGLLWIFSALIWRGRAGALAEERMAALESFDAATGLSHARIGQARLPLVLKRAARFEVGCGVIMLRWLHFHDKLAKLDTEQRGAVLTRFGLILQRLMRDIDTAARHSDDHFLILVEGPVTRESLAALCGKVLSECMRSSEKIGDPNLFDVQAAIWHSALGAHKTTAVMEALTTRLRQMADGTARRVQFVDTANSVPHADTPQEAEQRNAQVLAKIKAIESQPSSLTVSGQSGGFGSSSISPSTRPPISKPASLKPPV